MSLSLRAVSLPMLVFLCAACSGSATPAGDPGSGEGTPELGSPGDGGSSAWTLIQRCSDKAPDDFIAIESVEIEGDTLTIEAGHSAGCAEHTYGLCYEKSWAESDPVQIGLRLMHDAHGEKCEAYQMLELHFELSPLKDAYKEAYQVEGGSIRLSLSEQSILYTFGSREWEQVEAALDAANTCDVVADCHPISTTPCKTAYVNKSADTTEIEAMIAKFNHAELGDDNVECAASCACGVLSCNDGKCETEPGMCDATLPPDLVSVCL